MSQASLERLQSTPSKFVYFLPSGISMGQSIILSANSKHS